MRFKKVSNEVVVPDEAIVKVNRQDIESLKRGLGATQFGRIRLCAHRSAGDPLHEMLIVLAGNTYIRPHKHFGKSESFHVVEGSVDVVVFDDAGAITEIIQMGDYASGRRFYYRLADAFYHTLLIRSELLVLHETTNGPFKREDTEFAPWAPKDEDAAAVKAYRERLEELVEGIAFAGAGKETR